MSTKSKVGVVGTGAMGSRFARRLADAGYAVSLWNRTRSRAEQLTEVAAVQVCDTPRELAEAVDIVLCMVWDSEALLEVVEGEDGILAAMRPGKVVADLSTVEPEVSIKVAAAVAERGGVMLDSPVSGSLDAAEAGTVVIMVGGPSAGLEVVGEVFDVLGRAVLHAGEANGAGLAMKLAINLQVAIQEVGFGEGLALAQAFGIERGRATEIMLQSVIASPMLHYRVPFVSAPPQEVWASAAQLRKDVRYALDRIPGEAGAGAVARKLLDQVISDGRGDREAAELIVEAAHVGEEGSR
jgi:3-hydroxyisobutyrate dehydrogenase-like beta-hydroxyacid dehydrogenase